MKKILSAMITLMAVISVKAQTFNYAFSEEAPLNDAKIVCDAAGNVFVAGTFTGILDIGGAIYESDFYARVILIKYNATGAAEWAMMANSTGPSTIHGLALDKSGGVVITFGITSDVVFGDAAFDVVDMSEEESVIVGLSSSGSGRYQQMASSTSLFTTIRALDVDKAGNKYFPISGMGDLFYNGEEFVFPSPYNLSATVIVKTDKAANILWGKQLFTSGTSNVYDVAVDKNGFITVLGSFTDTLFVDDEVLTTDYTSYFLMRMDVAGNIIWIKNMPYSSFYFDSQIILDLAGNVYMTTVLGNITIDGNTFTSAVLGFDHESLITKFNKNTGAMEWSQKLNTYGTAIANSMHFSRDGRLFIAGKYRSYLACDVMELINDGDDADEAFVLEMDRNGNVVDLYDLNSGGVDDEIMDITFDGYGNMYWIGNTTDELTLGAYTVGTTAGFWVAKIQDGTYRLTPESNDVAAINLYPNPSNNHLTISLGTGNAVNNVTIVNAIGEVMMQMTTATTLIDIQVAEYPAGIYYLQCGNQSKPFEVVH